MNSTLIRELYERIDAFPIVDIHTHVDWKTGTARNVGDILRYHYYTELINSAEYQEGRLPLDDSEALTETIMTKLHLIGNTVQYDWLMTISREYLGLDPWDWNPEDWQLVYERSIEVMDRSEWREELITLSDIRRVFLTNQYDDDLEGLDTSFYTPCLRTEPFVTGMVHASEREGLGRFLGRPLCTIGDVGAAVDRAFERFVAHGMGYAAISSPVNLRTWPVSPEDAERVLCSMLEGGEVKEASRNAWYAYAMELICAACRKYGVPFHLMIGVDRDVYKQGVPQGADLFDAVNSMRGYDHLFNSYPDVRFPVAVLADTTGLELTAASWIRHNVYPSGHWWYSNQPTDIAREVRRRLDVVPGNKPIGYFSDAYYLEFILPKFRMYKFELATVLAERMERSLVHPNMEPLTFDDALELAERLLVTNPVRILGIRGA